MGISMLGLLINDLTFIVTAFFLDHLPGGYWFLMVGFILEGLLGGESRKNKNVSGLSDQLKGLPLGLPHRMLISQTALTILSGAALHSFMLHSIK